MVAFLVCVLLTVRLADCGPARCPQNANHQNQQTVEL
jgi:hypothetical protein